MYALEKHLQKDLMRLVGIYETETGRNSLIRREMGIGGVIPDLLVLRIENHFQYNWWPYRWTSAYAWTLWELRKAGCVAVENLSRSMAVGEIDRAKKILKDLIKAGFIQETSDDKYIFTKAYAEMKCEFIAFEAKLTRWKEALEQAKVYQEFSDRSFVVMDKDGMPTEESQLQEFIDAGVGLSYLSETGEFEIVLPAAKNDVDDFHWERTLLTTLDPKNHMYWTSAKAF